MNTSDISRFECTDCGALSAPSPSGGVDEQHFVGLPRPPEDRPDAYFVTAERADEILNGDAEAPEGFDGSTHEDLADHLRADSRGTYEQALEQALDRADEVEAELADASADIERTEEDAPNYRIRFDVAYHDADIETSVDDEAGLIVETADCPECGSALYRAERPPHTPEERAALDGGDA